MDFIKLLAIYFVVLGHVVLFMGLDRQEVMRNNPVYIYIYSFHMPLFMTISGFFSHKLLMRQGDIKKKFQQLIIPCISLGIVCLIFNIHTLNFWYLKSLFICYVIWDVFFILFRKKMQLGIFLFMIAGFIFFPLLTRVPYLSAYKVDFMLPFFGLGILIYHYKDKIQNHVSNLALIFTLLFVVSLILWNSSYIWYFSKPLWIDYEALIFDKELVTDFTTFQQTMWRYVVGALGSCCILFLFWSINKNLKLGGVISRLGKYGQFSLHIYIIQSFIVEVNLFHIKFPVINMNLYNYVYAPLFAFLVVIVCILIAQVLEKNKYIAFAFFGKSLNSK